jgi:anti-sigma-K factor RskA
MHTDPDLLALLALGEQAGTPTDHAHLSECLGCRAELAELTRIVEIGQHTEPEDPALMQPPERVWEAVRAELGFDGARPAADQRQASVTVLRRPRHRGPQVVLAAAVALVVGLGVAVVAQQTSTPTAAPVIQATMNALPAWPGASGLASVEQDAAGNRYLVISLTAPEPLTGEQEVWMSDNKAEHMQAMGKLTDGHGRFLIPAGTDLKASPVVDISAEPAGDTNPAHSNNSIVRCRLPV